MSALTCVVLAHNDPRHVQRLVRALHPFPVVLHCDVRTPAATYADMTEALPDRVVLLPRLATGWARWENVAAEVAGYEVALQTTSSHIAVLTGSDYPLWSAPEIARYLDARVAESVFHTRALPIAEWGRSGGMARLRYPHRPFRKHMIRVPIPRSVPPGLSFAGGSQVKVLSRRHAEAVVDVTRSRPDLVKFWRHSWIADETYVATILNTPGMVPDWATSHTPADPWFIDWGAHHQKSPEWLTMAHLGALVAAATDPQQPRLFARKFSTATSADVLAAIDQRRESNAV